MRVLVGCTDSRRADDDLAGTLLWRSDVHRQVVTTISAAQAGVRDTVSLILLERETPWAPDFIRRVRENDSRRGTSIAVYASGEMDGVEMDLMAAGANAVLRLPVTREWDKRLARLLQVPPRQAVRVPVFVEVETEGARRTTLGTTVNLSENGFLIEASALDLGTELDFAFRLAGAADPVRGRARVLRVAADDAFGLEFTDISGESLQAIRAFVTRNRF
jgi:hypothetical protein